MAPKTIRTLIGKKMLTGQFVLISTFEGNAAVSKLGSDQIEGTTLRVYVYVVKEDRPLGPRDVMRGLQLSSPSVAYRHLQKLESSGFLKKDEHGEYVAKRKMSMAGFHWVGKIFYPDDFLFLLLPGTFHYRSRDLSDSLAIRDLRAVCILRVRADDNGNRHGVFSL